LWIDRSQSIFDPRRVKMSVRGRFKRVCRFAVPGALVMAAISFPGLMSAPPSAAITFSSIPPACITAPTTDQGQCPPGAPTIVATAGSLFSWAVNARGVVYTNPPLETATGLSDVALKAPIVAIAPAAGNNSGSYWLVGADGGVFAFGDAHFYGSLGRIKLQAPIVGIDTTPDLKGYWLVGADGGVFAFGDAHFYGSLGRIKLQAPIVSIIATRDGKGYWLVGADGGVFALGDAPFFGSLGGAKLNAPVVGMTLDQAGDGYWLVGTDGGIFTFGKARFHGSFVGQVRSSVIAATTYLFLQVLPPPLTSTDEESYCVATTSGQTYCATP
jgi:hypothetical protein